MYKKLHILVVLAIMIIGCMPIDAESASKYRLIDKYPVEMVHWHYQKIGMLEPDFLHYEFDVIHDVYVAVIDSGLDMTGYQPYHVSQTIWGGNTISGTLDVLKPSYLGQNHGSQIVSTIIATANGKGNLGTCFLPSCKTIIYNALDQNGTAPIESIITALKSACENPLIKVINFSVEVYSYDENFKNAIENCWDNDKIVVLAGGNSSLFVPYSATIEKAIVVGAIDVFDKVPFLFPVTDNLTVFAPGVNIYTLNNARYKEYVYASGTSIATAMVSGIVALYLTQHPDVKPQDIKDLLYETAVRPNNWPYKAGIVNVNNLLKAK